MQTNDGTAIPGADVTVWATAQGSVHWNRDASEFGREHVAAGATGADGVFRTSLDLLRDGPVLQHVCGHSGALRDEAEQDDAGEQEPGGGSAHTPGARLDHHRAPSRIHDLPPCAAGYTAAPGAWGEHSDHARRWRSKAMAIEGDHDGLSDR
ncbi:MAG TPA: hypothetical protein VFZ65_23040 [Planctomycetota bacterium]|nr:hypothetical protein [Planctomycetota bacterium]